MRLIDLDSNKEYAPIWIDSNNNLVITTELIRNQQIDGVIVMDPCGMGNFYRKLLGTKEREEWH